MPESEVAANSVDEKLSQSTTSQEETTETLTKEEPEVKEDKKQDVVDSIIDGIEETDGDERGKFTFKIGDSVYFGDTQKEVVANAMKGIAEKDSYIKKLKVAEKVKVPDAKQEEKVEQPINEIPDDAEVYGQHLQTEVKKAGVDPKMLAWKDDDWISYQDDHNLRDFQLNRIMEQVKGVIQRANELTDRDMAIASVAVNNNKTLEQATKNVREMLADAGVDIDKFDYKAAIDSAMEKKDKSGRLPYGAVEAESSKQIMKILRSGTTVKKSIEADIVKGKEAKSAIKTATNGTRVKDNDNEKILGYDELTRQVKSRLATGSGRDI